MKTISPKLSDRLTVLAIGFLSLLFTSSCSTFTERDHDQSSASKLRPSKTSPQNTNSTNTDSITHNPSNSDGGNGRPVDSSNRATINRPDNTKHKSLTPIRPNNVSDSLAAAAENKTSKQDPLPPASTMEAETLYDLIVAEMAGKANRLNVTLGNYLKQANYTKNPKIIARATRIAKYMGAHQATFNAANLWLEVDPNNIEAHQAVTVQLIRNNKYDAALQHMSSLLRLSSEPNFDFLIHHTRKIDKEARQNIIAGLKKLTQNHPENSRLWFTKAILEDFQGSKEAAILSVERSLEIEPNYVTAVIFKAKTLRNLHREEDAFKTLKQAVKKHPDHKRLRIVYARLLISLNKLSKAQAQFEYLIKRNPDDSDLLLSLALLSWENELEKQAIEYLHQLLETGKKTGDAHTYLGQIYASEKKHKNAIKHFNQVQNGPNYTTAQIQLALVYSEINQVENGIDTLHQAIKKHVSSKTQFLIAESEILINAERLDEAYIVLNRALQEEPSDSDLLYSRAMLAEKLNNLDQLESDLRLIIKENPSSALALNALGYTLADRSDRLEEALELITQAAKIEPNDPAIIDSLGWVHYKLGNNAAALQHLRNAYKLYKDHEIAAHLGEVLWNEGLKEEATALWKSSKKEFPDSAILKKVMDRFLK